MLSSKNCSKIALDFCKQVKFRIQMIRMEWFFIYILHKDTGFQEQNDANSSSIFYIIWFWKLMYLCLTLPAANVTYLEFLEHDRNLKEI